MNGAPTPNLSWTHFRPGRAAAGRREGSIQWGRYSHICLDPAQRADRAVSRRLQVSAWGSWELLRVGFITIA